jgi:hypothetical protein
MSPGLTFTLIITAELILLFRLALPDMLNFFEQRFLEVYGAENRLYDPTHGDCFTASLLTNHDRPNIGTEA